MTVERGYYGDFKKQWDTLEESQTSLKPTFWKRGPLNHNLVKKKDKEVLLSINVVIVGVLVETYRPHGRSSNGDACESVRTTHVHRCI